MIKVFTTKTCAYCPGVKKYLKAKGVEFESIDALDNPKEFKTASAAANGATTVPITLFLNEVAVVGPNFGKLAEQIQLLK